MLAVAAAVVDGVDADVELSGCVGATTDESMVHVRGSRLASSKPNLRVGVAYLQRHNRRGLDGHEL